MQMMAKSPFSGTAASQFFSLASEALDPMETSVRPSPFWTGLSRDSSEEKGWPMASPEADEVSLHEFDVREPPCLVEEGGKGAVETE